MKKVFTFLSLIFVCLLSIVLCACNDTTTEGSYNSGDINPSILAIDAEEDKEILISYTQAGYGDQWIKEAVKAFNRVYEGHGYKAVLGRCDANFGSTNVENEIKYPQGNDYDLYFTISENLLTTLIDSSYSVMRDRNKTLIADLSDLLEQSPIDLNGYEESYNIGDSFNSTTKMFNSYTSDPESSWNGKTYGIQWTSSIGGMVVNTELLSQFGLEIPRTTTELKAICDYVVTNSDTVYPVTWAGANASGYFAYTCLTWLGQYMGLQGYEDFFAFIPETGDMLTNGYDVYDNIGIQYSFDALRMLCDQYYAPDGTVTTIGHLESEEILADSQAIFCITGDWCYNELIGCEYTEEELECIELMPVPVLSEVADLVGFTGTAERKDQMLSAVIKGLDEDKTSAQIIADIQTEFGETINEAQVARIAEARGIYFDLGTTHNCFVPSYSDNIDGAKLFLRFILSKEFAEKVYARYAHGVTANTFAKPNQNNYLKSMARITGKSYSNSVGYEDKLSEIRMKGGVAFTFDPYSHWIDFVKSMAVGDSEYTGSIIYNRCKNAMKNNWATILETSGLTEED